MKLNTEIVEEKQKALIVSKKSYGFISHLKNRLKASSVEPFFSSKIPKKIAIFDYCFFINEPQELTRIKDHTHKKLVFIFLKHKGEFRQNINDENTKIIATNGEHLKENDIDKILWFAFSKTKESVLNIITLEPVKKFIPSKHLENNLKKYLTRKYLTMSLIVFVLLYHIAFIIPLGITSLYTFASYNSIKKQKVQDSQQLLDKGRFYLGITQKLYSFSRPTLALFSISLYPDNIIDLNARGQTVLGQSLSSFNNMKQIQELLFRTDKDDIDRSDLILRLKTLDKSLSVINDNIDIMDQKIPGNFSFSKKMKQNLIETSDLLGKSRRVLSYLEEMLPSQTPKKYLIFFANNRELRPGGGFIGSFGILNIENYTIDKIKIYDVYDADGQLQAHIDPPVPIQKYLGVPHWFLRDSNFSPDFLENYQKALFFLEKEMGFTDFQGTALITTSAIENILSPFGDIYIPDYKEYINAKNFYLKTQLHVENDFFPGSTQKGNFLSSLMNQIFINLDQVSFADLGQQIKKSLDEKQIVVYVNDEKTQSLFDSSYWSGRVIEPKCSLSQNCIIDYLFPYDANLGANKANYYINRDIDLKTTISKDGTIDHLLSIQYKNNSPALVFPTGLYRDYFQVLIPRSSTLKQVTKDGVLVNDIDQKDDQYKMIGFFFEVPPQKTVEIKIDYSLEDKIADGDQMYQFVVQKQIGAMNSDFILEFQTAKNISILNQNFSPIVKDSQIIYNTNLSTDKIFLVELIKNNL